MSVIPDRYLTILINVGNIFNFVTMFVSIKLSVGLESGKHAFIEVNTTPNRRTLCVPQTTNSNYISVNRAFVLNFPTKILFELLLTLLIVFPLLQFITFSNHNNR